MVSVLLSAGLVAFPLASFASHWRCEGHFIATGKPIASQLTLSTDPASGVFIVRHDDSAPHAYHSIEIWTKAEDGEGLDAAVADRFSGLRVFHTPALRDGVLAFSRADAAGVAEEFRYFLSSPVALQVDWSIARAGQPLRRGDTLHCRKTED